MQSSYKPGSYLPGNLSRRQILRTTGAGFGALALAGMLAERSRAAEDSGKQAGPLVPKAPHFAAKAKRIIFLFLEGAFSQLDTWEYKPALQAGMGKPVLAAERWFHRSSSSLSMAKRAHGCPNCFLTAQDMSTNCVSCADCIPIHQPIRRL